MSFLYKNVMVLIKENLAAMSKSWYEQVESFSSVAVTLTIFKVLHKCSYIKNASYY